jgi:Ca2+-binding RTX toxin-like protein
MSIYNKAGSIAYITYKAYEVKQAYDAYQAVKDSPTATDAAFTLATKIAEFVGLGIPVWYANNLLTKTGLDRVFDSLKKDQPFDQYLKDQTTANQLREVGAGIILEISLNSLRDYVIEHALLDPIFDTVSDWYTRAQRWLAPRRDPLTFDLDGDGIETVGIDPNNPILFDHDADGVKTTTGWVLPDDAFLVLDRNGNGTIDNGTELFGDSTPLLVGGNAADGFAALQDQDTNADGQVNANDANFANLRLWQDLNQNGISEANELFTLNQKGIASINVTKTENNTLLPNGNVLADTGSYTKTDGTVGSLGEIGHLGDVDLTENTFRTEYPTVPPLPETETLPDMHGSGRVRNLRDAATLDADVRAVLTGYANATSRAEQIGQLDNLLLKWSQTSDLPDVVARALEAGFILNFTFGDEAHNTNAGSSTLFTSGLPDSPNAAYLQLNQGQSAGYQEWIDKISVLERFNGRNFFNFNPPENAPTVTFAVSDTVTPGGYLYSSYRRIDLSFSQPQLDFLNQSYEALRQSVYNSLFLQTRGQEYLDAIGLTVDENGNVVLDFSGMQQHFDQKFLTEPLKGFGDLIDLYIAQGEDLKASGWDGLGAFVHAETALSTTEAGLAVLADPSQLGPDKGGFRFGSTASDTLQGDDSANIMLGGADGDLLWGRYGDDLLFGNQGNDTLDSGFGNDALYGGAGDDTLQDANGDDAFFGGLGNDLLKGNDGIDTYYFNRGDGHDTVIDFGPERNDRFVFGPGIGLTDLHLIREAYDLTLDLGGGDQLTVRDWFREAWQANYEIEYFQFADGLYSASQVLSAAPMIALPTEDDDVFNTGAGNDTIHALGGNDTITDKGGSNVIDGGVGNDWIWVEGNGANLIYGGEGNDTVQASFDANNTIDGGAGDDYLLVHRSGGSPLTHNTFLGGSGNDQLYGSASTDTFIYSRGDGSDTINDYDYGAQGATDTVQFGMGISSNDITVSRSGDHLLLRLLDPNAAITTDQITIQWWFADPVHHHVERFAFADGTVLTDTQMQARVGRGRPSLNTPLPDAEVGDNAAFTLDIPAGHFTDPDSDETLTYRASLTDGNALPDWLTFDSLTGTFSGRPFDEHIGSYDITVTAFDPAGYYATDGFTLTVFNANDPPVVAAPIADLSTDEDAVLNFRLPVGTFIDPNAGDVLTYMAALTDGSALPTWLGFDAQTQTFTGTPTNTEVGSLAIAVTVTDGEGLSASDTFTLTVNNVNDAPVVMAAIPDQSTNEDAPFGFILDGAIFGDDDFIHGDSLILSATLADDSALPNWLVFDAATGTFGGVPANADVGVYDLRVTAADESGATASTVFTLTVNNINDAPIVANAIADQTSNEDVPFSFTVPSDTFFDDDLIHGDSLALTASLADGSVLPDWLVFDASTGTFSGTPDNWAVGTYEVQVTATDTAGTSVSDVFSLAVQNTNDAPILANPIPDQLATEGLAFNYVLPGDTFSDDDALHGDVLAYEATLSDGSVLPSWLTFDAATRTFTGTASPDSVLIGTDGDDVLVDTDTDISGAWDIQVSATDTSGISAQDTFTLTLQGVAGNDTLNGGKGNDALNGGGGNDTYRYNPGDGLDTLTDREGNDTIAFGTGFTFDNTIIRLDSLTGLARLRFLDTDGNEGAEGIDIALNSDGSSPIESFTFQDGSRYTLNDLLIGTQTLTGTKKADTLIGDRSDDTIYAGKGGDSVYGRTGNDILHGEKGHDRLYGEGGNDALFGGKGKDLLDGGAGDDLLDGGKGHNTLIGGKGNDTILLGKGQDTILFNLGDGWDTLISTAKDPEDSELHLGPGITQQNLWFSRTGDNLQINILGTDDGMTIEGWYSNKHKPIEEIQTANGDELEAKQVALLVQAMAAFTPAPGSGTPLPTEMPQELQATLAAAWEAD